MPHAKVRIVVATRYVLSPEDISSTVNAVTEMVTASWPEIANDFAILIGCTEEIEQESMMVIFVLPQFSMPYDHQLIERMENHLSKVSPVAGKFNPVVVWGNSAIS